VLHDMQDGAELDRGYLISAKDLSAHDYLAAIADAGIGCLKIEGRKKKPEYVATVTHAYREWLDRLAEGTVEPIVSPEDVQPLVQIYSRGFTGGMYGGRAGKEYITRDQPDNRGIELGAVVGFERGELIVELSRPLIEGDGVGFVDPSSRGGPTTGFTVEKVRTLAKRGTIKQAIATRNHIPVGWRVYRTFEAALMDRARKSYASIATPTKGAKVRLDVRLFGSAGTPLKAVFTMGPESVTVRTETTLSPASKRPLDYSALREQLGRLGDTPFSLGTLDVSALAEGLFLPVSELNHLRQQATEQLAATRQWEEQSRLAERELAVREAVDAVPGPRYPAPDTRDVAPGSRLSVNVYTIEDAEAAAESGATEVVFDPFLRHPVPPVSRVSALGQRLRERGVTLRLRTPTIVRPEDRKLVDKWLLLDLPILSGHMGLMAELARTGRDVVADYAVNVFNQHTAAEMFRLGANRIVLSVELTAKEMIAVAAPWEGVGFDVVAYGRPEGMTIEHCVLSAAFDREVTTCRDLCVKKHTNVQLTDPAGYTFPVATDYACRNRLLHSRPIDGSEFIPELWRAGIRGYQLVFNLPGDPIRDIVRSYRAILDDLASGVRPDVASVRQAVGAQFTRGHFARAV
jgi:putative protease